MKNLVSFFVESYSPWGSLKDAPIIGDRFVPHTFSLIDNPEEVRSRYREVAAQFMLTLSVEGGQYVYKHRAHFDGIEIMLPPRRIFDVFRDKVSFARWMQDAELSRYLPRTYESEECQTPCIAKVRLGTWGEGTNIIRETEELSSVKNGGYLLQEPIYGRFERAATCFCVDGQVCASTGAEYELEKELFIRGANLGCEEKRREIELSPAEKECFQTIARKSSYTGIFAADYKLIDGIPKIFEINPRLGWTSFKFHLPFYLEQIALVFSPEIKNRLYK